ncbi:Protein CBG03227 [Caenorhabditis briggsae]|uniref:DUF7754 domain-containing protein n=2 Tax=Caenorhabditis briggsae TaxID=6238 RepID=A0AAE9DIT5_CAEBR|nr:Protein CBG03227 [Caenorhabditis briggsae]ULU05583.1 hypothetical protein L3Y34_017911 [Caenorhabditis briggsae]CAP23440.1 Protein CBG03227 [Caenorhabditis briggsae]
MSLSELSVLSAETAISFHEMDLELLKESQKTANQEDVRMSVGEEAKTEAIQETVVFVAVDDQNLKNGPTQDTFVFEKLLFCVKQVIEYGFRHVYLSVQSTTPAEWQLLVQLRIKTGCESHILNVVDKDVYKFDGFSYPLNVEVQTNDVKFLKFEMRVLNMMYLDLPTFQEGDEVIEFDDGSRIRVHANILALLSDFMSKAEKEYASRSDCPAIRATSSEKEAFLELLYQAYPTRRVIYASFRRLTAGAVGYKCDNLIYHLSKHLIEYNYRPMTFLQRFQAAIENRLEPAIRELAFQAALNGTWNRMIQSGFEPENFCGRQVYTQIVCPAILKARTAKPDATTLQAPTQKLNFIELEAGDTTKSAILFRGTSFYINSGLLAAHGKEMLCIGQNGEYIARYTPEFHRECARGDLIPGEVLIQLLAYMHPMGDVPHPDMIRACIVFAHDHGWNVIKENLELEFEPPITPDEYMSQLVFGDKFDLKNLLRVNIQRAESSCRELAEVLEKHGKLKILKDRTREGIMDRMCSGWGLNPMVNRLSTRFPTTFHHRTVNLQRGKAVVVGEGRAIDTLNSLASEHAFGEINELIVLD